MRSLLLLTLLMLAVPFAACATTRDVEVARLQQADAGPGVDAVRAAPETQWIAADAMRRQAQPNWWRIRLAPGSDAEKARIGIAQSLRPKSCVRRWRKKAAY